MNPRQEVTLDQLLDFIKESRGFDFTGYKRASIERRIAKRMGDVKAENYEQYTEHLETHAEEFAELFNTILINVTGFFRDPATWEFLAEELLPGLVAERAPDSPLRVWVAGCASGEEAYTVAMVLARVLGDDGLRDRVKVYATDVDEEALEQARHGAYLPRQIEDIPADALDRFFERSDRRYVVRKDLRRSVIFGRNDLVQDAPISHLDLLVCRNTLMYFTAETQAQMLRRFNFALDNDGLLVLGKSEMLITQSALFTPIDLKRRIFRKVPRPTMRARMKALVNDSINGGDLNEPDDLRETAFNLGTVAQAILDADGSLIMVNDAARSMFGVGPADLGRPIKDLELSYRPVELRSHLETLSADLRALELKAVEWRRGEEQRYLDVRLVPLVSAGVLMGSSITYEDVSERHRLQDQLEGSKRELERAYEELQATVEELETTNEELQSTNEELETTNEELQSTNEEFETMNEELQSSNEELETMNDELRHRSSELNELNAFLETILTTMGLAVAVLDRDLHVQIWNGQAHQMWGLSPEEAEDQNVLALDIGLPVERLKTPIRSALNGSEREEKVLDSVNRRGKPFQCRVTVLPLRSRNDDHVSGLILMMEPDGA